MSVVSLLVHERRRAGPAALTLPVLAAAGIAALAVLFRAMHPSDPAAASVVMVRLVTDLFPVTVGLAAAAIVGRERCLELQLTVPTDYRSTLARRLAALGLVMLAGAIAAVVAVEASDEWVHPAPGAAALLVPLGPAVLLAGAGVWAGVRLGSTGAASMVVLGVWLAQLTILDRFLGAWPVRAMVLFSLGMFGLAAARRWLAASETVLAVHSQGGEA